MGNIIKIKNIVVGAGISGAVIAREIAEKKNEKVLIIEKRNHISGNCYDYFNKQGILIHKYGPHIFHTDNKKVWEYLSRFTEWEYYHHKVLAHIDGQKIHLPINLQAIYQVFPYTKAKLIEETLLQNFSYNEKVSVLKLKKINNKVLNYLADYMYEKIFKNYTIKQWGVKPENISPKVIDRVPMIISKDNGYFTDQYQGLPKYGYTNLFKNILDHKNIKIMLNTNFCEVFDIDINKKKMFFNGHEYTHHIYYSGKIDEFFKNKYGELPYRSLKFETEIIGQDYFQEVATVNYPNDYNFTRITEYKHFYSRDAIGTCIVREYPEKYDKTSGNPPCYPVFNNKNLQLFDKYLQLSQKFKNLQILGRLAEYKYFDMDDAVDNALNKFEQI